MIGIAFAAASILVVVLDDVSRTDFESVALPRMQSLRARSTYFTRAYSMPVCSPTRFAIQFGEYGFRHGVGSILTPAGTVAPAPEDVLSLAEVLREGGYRTLHAGKWHLSTKVATAHYELSPNLHGYDEARAWSHGNPDSDSLDGVKGEGYSKWIRYDDGVGSVETAYSTTAIVDATIDWWRHTPGRKFAHVNLHAPHDPLHMPPASLLPPGHPLPTTARELWEAMLIAADTEIGRLLDAVNLENTYVLLFSDNGTPSGVAADPAQAKGTVFEGGVNVPLYVAGPRVLARRSERLVHLVDTMATVLQIAGIPLQVGGDGISFADTALPRLEPNPERDWVYLELFRPNSVDITFPPVKLRVRGIRAKNGFKLIVRETTAGELEELFRLPNEVTPQVKPNIASALRKILDGI